MNNIKNKKIFLSIFVGIIVVLVFIWLSIRIKCNKSIIFYPAQETQLSKNDEYYEYKKTMNKSNSISALKSQFPGKTEEDYQNIYTNLKNKDFIINNNVTSLLGYITEHIKFKTKKDARSYCFQEKLGF